VGSRGWWSSFLRGLHCASTVTNVHDGRFGFLSEKLRFLSETPDKSVETVSAHRTEISGVTGINPRSTLADADALVDEALAVAADLVAAT
jgi:hypothetical protein